MKLFQQVVASLAYFLLLTAAAEATAAGFPDPVIDSPPAAASGRQTAVLAGGCFWGIQAVFQHVKGVISATSGYTGGSLKKPDYEAVASGRTGHAESVSIVYDPAIISYGALLKIFFSVAHDPTQLNRQGPDTGTQYRSAIFYGNGEQQRIAQSYIGQLQASRVLGRPIVTKLSPLTVFYPAEPYHQDYVRLHPDEPYIMINDLPKVANLKSSFPSFYKSE